MRKLANEGDPDAIYQLGLMYESGEGFMQNTPIAIKRFREAADKGHEKAKDKLEQLSRKHKTAAYVPKAIKQPEADAGLESQNDPSLKRAITSKNRDKRGGQRFYFSEKSFKMDGATMFIGSENIAFLSDEKHLPLLSQNLDEYQLRPNAMQLMWKDVSNFTVKEGSAIDRTDRFPPENPSDWEVGLFNKAVYSPRWRRFVFGGTVLFYIYNPMALIEAAVELVSELLGKSTSKDAWNYDEPASLWHLEINTHDGGWAMIDRVKFIDGQDNSRLDLRMELRLFLEFCEHKGNADELIPPDQATELWEDRKKEIGSYINIKIKEYFWSVQGIYIFAIATFLIGAISFAVSKGGILRVTDGLHLLPACCFFVIGASFNLITVMKFNKLKRYNKKLYRILLIELLLFACVVSFPIVLFFLK